MTDKRDELVHPHPWVSYMNAHGTNGLLEHLWDRIAKLEAEVARVDSRRASDAMAAAYSRGGGHGF